jgi:hypothetical protein
VRPCRVLTVAAFALAIAAACSRGGPTPFPEPVGIDRSPHLTYAASCGQLEGAIEDSLVLAMKSEVEQIREGWGGVILANEGPAAASSPSGPTDFTTTNTQVGGVDEADFVQNDGTRIAVLADGRLHLTASWPADALRETGSLAIEGWPREFFLAGDQAVVFSSVYVSRALEGAHPVCGAAADWCGYWASDVTKVTTVDVSAMDAPRVTSEIYLPGSYLSARRIGARVRLVISDQLPFPDEVRFWPEVPVGASNAQRDQAFQDLEAKNEAVIRGRTLDDWLRHGSVRRPDGSTQDLGYSCGDFAIGSAPTRPGILTVATLDLDAKALASRTSVLAQADVVYASRDTLYAAASHWWWWLAPGQEDATYLHAFDLTDPDRAAYLGSGVVDGTVSSQYQLDEFEGALRVATTLRSRVEDVDPWGRVELSNQIAVLGLSIGALRTLGKTDRFGDGESVFGTRFLGARGFVITARNVDPLFTFDLADPAHPRKVGELSMPGFIGYLHPVDDTHLLGVGRERASSSGPMQVKVQLLDVADLTNPKASPPAVVGEGMSWSESLWDPKAFTWLPARKLLAIPFVDFAPDRFVSDLRLFHVDPATGITPAGSLSMEDVFMTSAGPGWSYSWSPSVRRGVLADDFVYAITDAGIRSANVADLPAWLATVTFPPLPAP